MQKNYKDVQFLFPNAGVDVDVFIQQPATKPFSEDAFSFLNTFSHELAKEDTRSYPELAALAFFCRKASIAGLQKKYNGGHAFRLGRGIIFHIAPSNVPLNFAYSLVCGILSGNSNIVRVPSKEFEQVDMVCEALKRIQLSGSHGSVTKRIVLVRYDKQSAATGYFSSICDVRIIWGGDETIAQVRKNPLPPRAFDVSFADRFSLCVINADAYVNETDTVRVAAGFYNDTYLYDQNACTSPHLITWLGSKENVEKSKKIFWNELYKIIAIKYHSIQPVIAVDKLTAFYTQASAQDRLKKIVTDDNAIWRIEMDSLPADIDKYRCSSGYFSEYHLTSLSELGSIINRSYQTLAYYGITKEELESFMKQFLPSGIDRIVPIGRTADFSLVWDGFELITTLSRTIEIISH
jgi:hypothetical protein